MRRVEYSLDTEQWHLLFPLDGIADSRTERFNVTIDPDEPRPARTAGHRRHGQRLHGSRRASTSRMLNGIFVFVVLTSVLAAALSGEMQALADAVIASARNAVDLAIGLVGVMAFFLGLIRVASDAGLMARLARLVSPFMRLLFPKLPADSPALSAMLLNISANMLGLANAATPFGIKAVEELDKHNGRRGTATDDMVLFLAINTSGLAIIPSGMIAIRASLDSSDPGGIFLTTWFASACATVVGITAAMLLARLPRYSATAPELLASPAADTDAQQDAAQAEMAAERRPTPVRRILAAAVLGRIRHRCGRRVRRPRSGAAAGHRRHPRHRVVLAAAGRGGRTRAVRLDPPGARLRVARRGRARRDSRSPSG